jgi:hypothetical protein
LIFGLESARLRGRCDGKLGNFKVGERKLDARFEERSVAVPSRYHRRTREQ